MADPADDIAAIRAFNRFYTGIIGLLEEGMHKSPHTLSEARLIHEIGKKGSTNASELSRELAMDPGQLSRLVWRLSDLGLIAMSPGIADRRSNVMALTADGDRVYEALNAASDIAAEALLENLSPSQRRDLVSAMGRIQLLLAGPAPGGPLLLRPHRIGEIGWMIHRQGLLYHLEQGWNGEFETLIARIYAEYAEATGAKSLWVAEQNGEVAGSVFILPAADEPGSAQLRMLYVEPAFRGLGIGKLLVEQAVSFSREAGYPRIILWTQDCLTSARKIYQAAGFELVREEPHFSFGTMLNGQYWALELGGR